MAESSCNQRRRFLRQVALSLPGLALLGAGSRPASSSGGVLPGIDVLARNGFHPLRGKRVGLLTHPAGVNRFGISTIEVLRASPLVRLMALFGPEHGIHGDEKANVPVEDRTDPRTGLPVYSLYGKFRRPTPAMLASIDTMVIDLQDIGSRSYTYVSCMRYVIEECFQAGKQVIVLDRPNPLGGLKVDGPPLEKQWMSYVGAFQVPYVHGLTIGELANMAKRKPGVLQVPDSVRRRGRIEIIPMSGWRRSMMWTTTGLRWIPTSPAIPDVSAALGYPMTGLGAQLGGFQHGYGTRLPFRLLQFPKTAPETISAAFSSRAIPGLAFPVVPFTVMGQPRRATFVKVTDWAALRPTELSLHMMDLARRWNPTNPFAAAPHSKRDLFTKHVGDSRVLDSLLQSNSPLPIQSLLADWSATNRLFQLEARAWWLYQP
ncbi:MAG: exo-beta-N-acetylmuramidase NamZ family protein [Oceanipulchritudo sp.]